MPDVFEPSKRSAVMSAIRGSGNKDTELRMIALMKAHRITGWRRKQKLFGKPDLVFKIGRVALFVDGCFWHSCPKPSHAPPPKSRADWWAAKLQRNHRRDVLVNQTLRENGWRVIRIWECDLTKPNWQRIAQRVKRFVDLGC